MAPDGFGGAYSAKFTNNSDTDDLPAWNAEGTRIAFESTRVNSPYIYRMRADGANPFNLTSSSIITIDANASWQPN
jgi:Tol biopolymer transport system component